MVSGDQRAAFGFLLVRLRREARMTQEDLAARSGISPRSIQNMERGRVRCPRRQTVELVADALGLAEDRRAEFERAARGPLPEIAPHATTGLVTLVAAARPGRWVDLRGLEQVADPTTVLVRLLAALDVDLPRTP